MKSHYVTADDGSSADSGEESETEESETETAAEE